MFKMKKSVLMCAFALLLGSQVQGSVLKTIRDQVGNIAFLGGVGAAGSITLKTTLAAVTAAYHGQLPTINYKETATKIITSLAVAAAVTQLRGQNISSTLRKACTENIADNAPAYCIKLLDSATNNRNALALFVGLLWWGSAQADNPSAEFKNNTDASEATTA